METPAFKYPLLRVEERFSRRTDGSWSPVPDTLISVADHVMVQFDARLS